MRRLIAWAIVIGIFVLAGEGFELIRLAILDKMANPASVVWWKIVLGILFMAGGVTFLGGLVFYREKKRGKLHPSFNKQFGSKAKP